MATRIVPFDDALWLGLSRFLHEHWQANHPLCQRDLFYWQYQGYGPARGVNGCRVALDGQTIVGFLGAIPGVYQFGDGQVAGVALALWVVAKEYRNSGLGILLMREVEKQGEVVVCLGVAPVVFRYYLATGYRFLPALHRYVIPLDAGGYAKLLNAPAESAGIGQWVSRLDAEPGEPQAIDPARLAAIWAESAGAWRLSLVRSEEFWEWRYGRAVGFEYVWFGDARRGAVVARLDRIRSTEEPELDGRLVLRIIEILPVGGLSGGLDGGSRQSRGIVEVLAGALAWAKAQGAIAGDFQCCSSRLEAWLSMAGMRPRVDGDPATQLPELFNPLGRRTAAINLMVKAKGWREEDFDSAYVVKSDGDMDRPARWPIG